MSYFLNIFRVRLLVVLLGGVCFVFGVWQHVEAAQWNRFYFYIACALIAPALACLVVHDIPLKAPIVEKLPLDKQETTLKESPIDKKTEIIKQLNKFVRKGNALLLQIGSAPSSQFPSKYPLPKNMKPSPMELKIAEWSKDVYNYLIVDVQTWAEYYHNLTTRDIVIKHTPYTRPQQKSGNEPPTTTSSRLSQAPSP